MFSAYRSVFTALLIFSGTAGAETVEQSWVDINFVPCEGVGIHGTGKISGSANITRSGSSITIHELTITSNHPHASGFAASISFNTELHEKKVINLVRPWYATIHAPDTRSMILPKDTSSSSGPHDQIDVVVTSGITISANVVFSLNGGNCAAGFTQTWVF